MKTFKNYAVALVVFLSALVAGAQSHVPTLQSNNTWLGINQYTFGKLQLNAGQSCGVVAGVQQVMAGYQQDFTPICVSVAGGTPTNPGVLTINGLTGNPIIQNADGQLNISTPSAGVININCPGCLTGVTNVNGIVGAVTAVGDANITVTPTGQNLQLHCPGCGTSGAATPPGGTAGAIQYNAGGTPNTFGGAVITGLVKSNGTGAPTAAIPDTDFALPFTISCVTGLTCPEVNHAYTFNVTGAAGTGSVANGSFGQVGGYASYGTTIQGAPGIFALNPAWSVAQMNALFSRFNGSQATSYAIASNVVTIQAVNSLNPGDQVVLTNFPTSTFLNGQTVTVLSSGLSQTQFSANFTHANVATTTEAGWASIGTSSNPNLSAGLVVIPPYMQDSPANAFTNGPGVIGPAAQVIDWRKAYGLQQLSAYGIKMDATQQYVTITSGSNQINVGADFGPISPVGMTMVVGQQVGYGSLGTQNTWVAKVTGFTYPNVTLSSNAPFNYTGNVIFGTNNQAALQRAFNDVGGSIPLWLPQGRLLTDTVRWNGASLLGLQMAATNWYGFPGKDILQQQDGVQALTWSINASAGTTTFTIPNYADHNVMVGDSVQLQSFPVSTFFNGAFATITAKSLTSVTVNSAFGQTGTPSGTEPGLLGPTTAVNQNAMRVENVNFNVNNSIDPTFPWNAYDSTGTLKVEPAYYRPIQEFSEPMNQPFAPGWGAGQVNGIASITEGNSVLCAPTTPTIFTDNNGQQYNITPRIPAVGTTIVFPYQGAGLFSTTVASTAGTCATGYTARTLTAAVPTTTNHNNTSKNAEWFTFTTPQTLAAAIPATITYPYTVQLALPFPPIPGWEANVSTHGRIIINSDEFDYAGLNFGGTAGGNPTLVLRDGPTSINAGAGDAIGAVTFPLNPCSAMFNNPWPVVPTLNNVRITAWSVTSNVATFTVANNLVAGQIGILRSGGGDSAAFNNIQVTVLSSGLSTTQFTANVTMANGSGTTDFEFDGGATPANATYYAGRCAGNAAMAFPAADPNMYQPFTSGMSLADFRNVAGTNLTVNASGNSDNNGATLLYEQGNNTGYGNTFDNIRVAGLWGGIVQGPASVNQHGVRAIGPTSTGQSFKDCTLRAGFGFTIVSMQQSNMDRCDTYSTEVSEIDGSVVGSSTGLFIGGTLSEEDGLPVTGVGQFTVKDYNSEPENGNHEEIPPSVVSDGTNITWLGNIFEGGYNIFGGSYQRFMGTQLSNPVFNYGNNNYFEDLYGSNNTYNDQNVYNGTQQFYNWGQFSTCQTQVGSSGLKRGCGAGFVQDYNGHDAFATMMGDLTNPMENILGGMITPGEFALAGLPSVYDPTELWWGQYSQCVMTTNSECIAQQFDGFNGYIFVGAHQRIPPAKMILKMNVKAATSGTFTFRTLISAQTPGGSSICTPNYSLSTQFFTIGNTWTPVQMPVDFTGEAGCTLGIQFDNPSGSNTLQVGYANFVPAPDQFYLPLGTPTEGNACPVAGEIQLDATHFWVCAPTSGASFGAGIWRNAGLL